MSMMIHAKATRTRPGNAGASVCQAFAFLPKYGPVTEDLSKVTCSRCAKTLGITPATAAPAHSEKADKTFDEMRTKSSDWKCADIKWVEEERVVPTWVTCPDCHGTRKVCKDAEGKLIPWPKDDWKAEAEYRQARNSECTTCDSSRKHYGRAKLPRKRVVWIGYVQWPSGVEFDSRFAHHDCHLCAKTLSTFAGRVPVVSLDGKHGMWVGADCAHKFMPGVQTREYAKKTKDGAGLVVDR